MESRKEYTQIIRRMEAARDVPAREWSFERFSRAFREFDLRFPDNGAGVALIAGTNGKGSVAKTLETLLSGLGYDVGLFTSPHLMKTTERIRSHGLDLTEEEFIETFRLIEPLALRHGLSHFETLTLMMAEAFFGGRIRPPVQRAVIEVGVGGRLDPTRLIPHEISVLTRIGLDHQRILGKTLDEIAVEKFAIVDERNIVVHAPMCGDVKKTIVSIYGHRARKWVEAEPFSYTVNEGPMGRPKWHIQTPWGISPLNLPGGRAVENTSLALRALDEWGEDAARAIPFLSNVNWPCRMEGFRIQGRTFFLSGDHNVQGIESLKEILSQFRFRRLHLVIGVAKNKPLDEILSAFSGLLNRETSREMEFHLAPTPFRDGGTGRYWDWAGQGSFAAWSHVKGVHIHSNAEDALKTALRRASHDDLVLASGSLYLAGALRSQLVSGLFGPFESLE